MKSWTRPLGALAIIAVIAGIYLLGRVGRGGGDIEAAVAIPADPGYAARDAEVIETGYDGRERYRLRARTIRQQGEAGVIDLEQLEMNYHPEAQPLVPGERPAPPAQTVEVWHLKSDRGQVRANGDDVELQGNVQVTGPAPGSDVPMMLNTESLRINTPTEFIETDAAVKLRWSGNELNAIGLEADLKAGKVRLKSKVHGSSAR